MIHLSEDLLIGFAKSMKTEERRGDVTLFGTVKEVEDEDSIIVTLDGSDAETKANCSTPVAVGDRVTVLMKDHSAVVTGNLSNRSSFARVEASLDPVDVNTDEWTVLGTFTGEANTSYLLLYGAAFNTNATGYRQLHFAVNNTTAGRYSPSYAAVTGAQTRIQGAITYNFGNPGTINLWARQNSGSTLTVYGWYVSIKLPK